MTGAGVEVGSKKRPQLEIQRIVGLKAAASMLGGQEALASAFAMGKRNLQKKLAADRLIYDADLRVAAEALRARATATIALADKLEALIGGQS